MEYNGIDVNQIIFNYWQVTGKPGQYQGDRKLLKSYS